MDDQALAEFTALLTVRRRDAERSLRARGAGAQQLLTARGDDNADDEHDPEGSTLSAEWSLVEGVRRAAQHELDEIDAALARVDAGTFGVCAACGVDIPLDRLRARPSATTHVTCAQHGAAEPGAVTRSQHAAGTMGP